jgi:hypothetical protein
MKPHIVDVRVKGRRPFRVVLGGRVANVATSVARMPMITLLARVYVRSGFTPTVEGVAHESEHVEQWHDIGPIVFPVRYVLEHLRRGYKRNRFEQKAREYALAHSHLFADWNR